MLITQAKRIILPHMTSEGLTRWNDLKPDAQYDEAKRLADTVKDGSAASLADRLSCRDPFMPWDKSVRSALCPATNTRQSFITTHPAALWVDFATLLDYDSEKLAVFQARLPTPISVPSQQVILSDDGTKPMQAVLGGVSGRSMAKVTAFLNVTPFDVKAWEPRPTPKISAQSLTFDGSVPHADAWPSPPLRSSTLLAYPQQKFLHGPRR